MLLDEIFGLLEATYDDSYAPGTRTANDIAHQKSKLGHSLSGNTRSSSSYRGDDQDDYSDPSWSRQAPPRTSPLTKTEFMSASDKVTALKVALKRTFGPKLLEIVKSFEHGKTEYLQCRIYIDYAKTEYLEFYFKCENSSSTFASYEKVTFRTNRDALFSNLDVYEWNEYGKWCGDDASETMSKLAHRITDIRKLVHDWENKKITKNKYWAGWDEMRRRFR